MANQETSNPENRFGSESATTSLKVLLPFLWAAQKELIHPVAKLCSFNPKVTTKVKEIHNMLRQEPTARPPQTNEDFTLAKVSQSLDRIVERKLMNGSASKTTHNKKSFEGRLSTIVKTLILTASASDSSSVLTEPSETSKEFFEQKNAAEAKSFLYHHLIVIQKLPLHLQADIATALYSGYFFWDTLGTPSNFSLFLLLPESGATVSDTADSIAFSLKSSDRRGGIDSDDIKD